MNDLAIDTTVLSRLFLYHRESIKKMNNSGKTGKKFKIITNEITDLYCINHKLNSLP